MDMKSCSSCKADNPTDANFCRKCGEMFDDANFGGVTEKLLQKYHEIKRMCSIHKEKEEELKVRMCEYEMEEQVLKCKIEDLLTTIKDKEDNIHQLKRALKEAEEELDISKHLADSVAASLHCDLKNLQKKYQCVCEELSVTQHELNRLLSIPRVQDNEINSFFDQVSGYKKFDILNVEVKNSGGETGNEIISQDTTYLSLQLTVAAYENQTITFQVKFFDSNGKLSVGDNSPSGYSYECTKELHKLHVEKVSLVGWGSEKKGYWSSGNYSTEIWVNGCLIYTKSFTIK